MPAQQHHYQAAFPPRHCPPSPPSTATSSPLHNAPSLQKEHTKSSWHHHHHHPSSSATLLASRTMTNATTSITTSNDDTSTFLNLERVVRQYSEQPELLGLILSSKVEEDRRRTEEARLKQKEIDYLLQQHQQQDGEPQQRSDTYRSSSNWQSAGYTQGGEKRHDENKLQNSSTHRRSSISWQQQPNTTSVYQDSTSYPNEMTTMAAESSTLPRIHTPPQHHHHTPTRRNSAVRHSAGTSWTHEPYPNRHDTTTIRRRSSSNIDMLLSHSPRLSRSSLPPISTSPPPNTLSKEPQSKSTYDHPYRSPPLVDSESESDMILPPPGPLVSSLPPQIADHSSDKLPIPPITNIHRNQESSSCPRRRRRREMQAISTIIETKEFPYNDDYLWKNNGNTVHKKSGYRSIYYKCSNSAKGCPVNKTVTFKEHGTYLIKYRGEHLEECSRIKRIIDV
ncbi:hypothetical protein RO3G_11823 [Lichtheimia corymbifera JMRC:FSU:9682]|uniref:WRKY domain-containing protein n=1 Tax=Lichtheimia corymbifera JMRC:FSU:9682 TaxID=1263082 RepID=A0A068S7W1_9FUNG|nr:hypothetical protein RO3G_11823 [Lichtheimia corymbifera JMRC:FSU:9682]